MLISILRQEVDVAVPWWEGQFWSLGEDAPGRVICRLREARTCPLLLAGPFPPTLTLLEAAPGDSTLTNKVVLGGGIVVLYYKAYKGKVRHGHLKLKLRVPPGVET